MSLERQFDWAKVGIEIPIDFLSPVKNLKRTRDMDPPVVKLKIKGLSKCDSDAPVRDNDPLYCLKALKWTKDPNREKCCNSPVGPVCKACAKTVCMKCHTAVDTDEPDGSTTQVHDHCI
jgi:hypothetical protein